MIPLAVMLVWIMFSRQIYAGVHLSGASNSHYFSGQTDFADFLKKTAKKGKLTDSFSLVLSSSQRHQLDSKLLITLEASGKQNLSIQGENETIPAEIFCQSQGIGTHKHSGGIALVHFKTVRLTNLVFRDCGALLSSTSVHGINSSDVFFDKHTSAVLLFNHCENLTLVGVSVLQYRGFALAAVNTLHIARYHRVLVSQGEKKSHHHNPEVISGSGVLFLYMDTELFTTEHKPRLSVKLVENVYKNNTYDHRFEGCQTDTYSPSRRHIRRSPVYHAAGLTIIFNQRYITVHVDVLNSTFTRNKGRSYASAMLVKHLNSHAKSVTVVSDNTVFTDNIIHRRCHGSAIVFYTYFSLDFTRQFYKNSTKISTLLKVTNTSFTRQNGKGAVFIGVTNQVEFLVNVHFRSVQFINNTSWEGIGVCMFVSTYIQLDLQNIGLKVHLESVQG